MKLGAVVGMRDDPEAFGKHLKKLEDAGVEYLWAGEAYTADAVSTMGFIAAVTSRAQIGSAHPAAVYQDAVTARDDRGRL